MSTTVIAFDLSLSNTGYAVGQFESGELTVVEKGSISTKKLTKRSTGERLYVIADAIKELYKKYPDALVVKERSFSNGRITATQQIYKVNGIFELMSFMARKQDFSEITPPAIKKELTGDGRASKEAVEQAVLEFTSLTFKNNDESDAVAVLIAYGKQKGLLL